jgi:hypothetical protein
VDTSLKGETLFAITRTVDAGKLDELAQAIGTPSAAQTATLVPFFGPSLQGEAFVRDRLDLDLTRALMGGIAYEWHRPFVAAEKVDVRLFVEDIYQKGESTFAIVTTEFRDAGGGLIQRQRATFIERGVK